MNLEKAIVSLIETHCNKSASCHNGDQECAADCFYKRNAAFVESYMKVPTITNEEAMCLVREMYQVHFAFPGCFPCLQAWEGAEDLIKEAQNQTTDQKEKRDV